MADMLAITKADGSNEEHAGRAASEYSSALHLFPASESGWVPQVLTCSAFKNKGMEEIWMKIKEYHDFTVKSGYFHARRKKQSLYWLSETIRENLHARFYGNKDIMQKLEQLRQEVLDDKISSFLAAQKIIRYYFSKF
jgi:LAO/AO transport system kinase